MPLRRHLIGVLLACLLAAMVAPVAASAAEHPFRAPAPRPTERLERPTEKDDPNRNSYTMPEAKQSPSCTQNFCVHWVPRGKDAPNPLDANANRIPDYVERVQAIAEEVYAVENGVLGWRDPKSDGTLGGDKDKTDIYLAQIGGALFGYASPDRDQAKKHKIPRRLHAYLVLDNNYAPSEFPGTTQTDDLKVTIAHEYNHILQFGYDAFQDPWFAEATATWMEDQVYDEINDYRRYVRRWVRGYNTPLAATTFKEYGSALWNKWLANRYGPQVIRSAWARSIAVKPGGFSVAAYDSAIRAAGGSDFNRDFASFAADLAEWRTESVFSEARLYPDIPRQGGLGTEWGVFPSYRFLNHTTFTMLRVDPTEGKDVVVRAKAPAGVSAGLALVGRIGHERNGEVVTKLLYKPNGGAMRVRLPEPDRYNRITAVVINADTNATGFIARRLDWGYLGDNTEFSIRARTNP